MTDTQGDAAGADPAAEPTDDELLESAAGGEQSFDTSAEGDGDADLVDVAALIAERDEFRDTLLRVKAEFDNHRKRVARDDIDKREQAGAVLAEKLLVVLDACDAAIAHGASDVEPIAKMLGELLEREGLEWVMPAGEPFDPNQHEAVMHEPGDGGEPVVLETLRIGYRWKGRVLRPAMVKVQG
jgi:molecular chaperone GrpE